MALGVSPGAIVHFGGGPPREDPERREPSTFDFRLSTSSAWSHPDTVTSTGRIRTPWRRASCTMVPSE